MVSPSSVPKPVLPPCSKRTHFAICDRPVLSGQRRSIAPPFLHCNRQVDCRNHALHHWGGGCECLLSGATARSPAVSRFSVPDLTWRGSHPADEKFVAVK